jgi:hypothetical protein
MAAGHEATKKVTKCPPRKTPCSACCMDQIEVSPVIGQVIARVQLDLAHGQFPSTHPQSLPVHTEAYAARVAWYCSAFRQLISVVGASTSTRALCWLAARTQSSINEALLVRACCTVPGVWDTYVSVTSSLTSANNISPLWQPSTGRCQCTPCLVCLSAC